MDLFAGARHAMDAGRLEPAQAPSMRAGPAAGWWRVAGVAAELGRFPCLHALATSSCADDVLCTVLLLVRRVFAMQAPAVPTIHREEPQGRASGELVLPER